MNMVDIPQQKAFARQKIQDLIQKFRNDPDKDAHNEEQLAWSYILPLISALGWNAENPMEFKTQVNVAGKRADFGCYLGGMPVFYLETKSNKHILETQDNIDQAVNYSYLKGITWAVLTNFSQLAVYNAELLDRDKRLFFSWSYEDFADDGFEDLWLLSKPAFMKGLMDKKAESHGVKAKRKPVTEILFNQLVEWRKELFEEFGYTTQYTTVQIDNAIQLLFDRLIFIRSMEDRRIEPHRTRLLEIANQGTTKLTFNPVKDEKKFNQDIHALFGELNGIYNSNLFAPALLDEFIFKKSIALIIKGLYASEKDFIKYDFSVISADILGAVYEQYLSFKAQDPSGKHTLKSIKKKSQGIYYTPQFVVKYIIHHTLGEVLKDHPNPLSIRVLDPTCGSGSFLIEAFDYLDDYFKNLIPDERHRRYHILTENLYGVDLDVQATEVTRLNLLLKATYERDRLPLLTHIKIGNSLINTDSFDWHLAFEPIFEDGGFDVIIGNPPYVRQEIFGDTFKNYLADHPDAYQEVFAGTADLYVYFIQRGLSLLKPNGRLGYILPNKWLCANYGKPLRHYLMGFAINQIVDFGTSPVFPNADVNACLLLLQNASANEQFPVVGEKAFDIPIAEIKRKNELIEKPSMLINESGFIEANRHWVRRSYLRVDGWTLAKDDTQEILKHVLAVGRPLGQFANLKMRRGVTTGYDKAFVIDKQTRDLLVQQDPRSAEIIKPYLVVDKRKQLRYAPPQPTRFLIFTRRGIDITQYPAIFAHLEKFKEYLVPKPDDYEGEDEAWLGRKRGKYQWYEIQDTTAYYHEFETPKIVYPEVGKRGQFTLDTGQHYLNATLFMISGLSLLDYYYLLGIFNSKLFTQISTHVVCRALSGSLRWKTQYMEKMPIPDATDAQRQKLMELVKKQLNFHAELASLHSTDSNRRFEIEEYITRTDHQIDVLVANLYGLDESVLSLFD